MDLPTGLLPWPQPLMAQTMLCLASPAQSSVFVEPSGVVLTGPIVGGNVQPNAMAPTIPVKRLLTKRPGKPLRKYH